MAPDHLDVTARTRMERVVNLRSLPLVAGTMSLFRVVEGWETQLGTGLTGAMFRPDGAPDLPHVGHDQASLIGAMFPPDGAPDPPHAAATRRV